MFKLIRSVFQNNVLGEDSNILKRLQRLFYEPPWRFRLVNAKPRPGSRGSMRLRRTRFTTDASSSEVAQFLIIDFDSIPITVMGFSFVLSWG